MTRPLAVVAVALLLAGCTTHRHAALDRELTRLQAERNAGADRAALAPRFGAVAAAALADARNARSEPATTVSLYRMAAQAAWQAGPDASALLDESTAEGTQACARLPQGDASAPRDCTLLRVARPLAVYDDLRDELGGLVGRRDALRAQAPPARLPAADGPVVERLYDGFETQVRALGAIRDDLAARGVRRELCAWVDGTRRPVYCGAAAAASLSLDVDGTALGGAGDLSARKAALRRDVEATLGAVDCRVVAPAVAPPP